MPMKNNIILLYKKLGETPLDTITRYKHDHLLHKDKLSFAGRLDPMAEGLLVVLVNDENKKRKSYEDLDKTYIATFITAMTTDTYDLLGKVVKVTSQNIDTPNMKFLIEKAIATLPGKQIMSYPPYSSYHVKGKPLYYLARKGELPNPLPSKEVTIHSAEVLEHTIIKKAQLANEIRERINLVHGDFRQDEIKKIWEEILKKTSHQEFLLTHMKIVCSSGTYIRQLVQTIGELIEMPTVTFSIKRTRIGPYSLSDLDWFEK